MFEDFTIYLPGLQPLQPALILRIQVQIEMRGALVKAIEDFGRNDDFAFWVADRKKDQGGLAFTLWNDAYRAVGSEIDFDNNDRTIIAIAFYRTYVQELPIDGVLSSINRLKSKLYSIKEVDIFEIKR